MKSPRQKEVIRLMIKIVDRPNKSKDMNNGSQNGAKIGRDVLDLFEKVRMYMAIVPSDMMRRRKVS